MAKISNELRTLMQACNKAERVMMTGPVESSCTILGQEGANYLAWCAAADAERACREREAYDEPCASRQLAAFA